MNRVKNVFNTGVGTHINTYSVSVSACVLFIMARNRQLLRDAPADAGFLSNRAAVIWDTIEGTICTNKLIQTSVFIYFSLSSVLWQICFSARNKSTLNARLYLGQVKFVCYVNLILGFCTLVLCEIVYLYTCVHASSFVHDRIAVGMDSGVEL